MQMNVIDYLKSKVLFYLFNSATKPTFMQNFSNICAIILKASIDWPTPTYEFYISVIQTQRYSNLLHYFDHSAKFGRFQSAKYNTMNKNVRKWPRICRKFNFESNNYISLRIFHEQQTFQLKTTINHANERDWLFQIQSFVLSVQCSNKTHIYVKSLCRLCVNFESEYRLTHTNLRTLHQRHPKTTL